MAFPWVSVAVLAVLIVGVLGLRFLSEWKQNINIFLTTLMAAVALAVTEITAISLSPSVAGPLEQLDLVGVFVSVIVIITLWYRRIPKIGLEKAETIAIEYVKTKHKGVVLDKNRQGFLRERHWHIFVNYLARIEIGTEEVKVDAGTGKVAT